MAFTSDKIRQGVQKGTAGYDLEQSLRFNKSDSAYLNNSFGTATNKKKWTYSIWVKGNDTSSNCQLLRSWTNDDNFTQITIQQTNYWKFDFFHRVSNVRICQLTTTQLIRDPSAWYHFVIKYDSTPSSPSSSDISIYINGVQVTDFSQETYPSQNTETHINNSQNHVIMQSEETGGSGHTYGGAYLSEVHFVDGTALDPTSFGEFGDYGEWKPIEVSGLTYGNNGFHLDFKTSGTLGNDANGSNNWTTNNLASTDQMLDTPTNNFATLNPIANQPASSMAGFSQGNLRTVISGDTTDHNVTGNFGMTTGKWYFEVLLVEGGDAIIGVIKDWADHQNSNFWLGGEVDAYAYYRDGNKRNNSNVSYGASFTAGDIISIELDMDNGTIDFHKNGVSQGEAFTGLSGTFFPVMGEGSSATHEFILNAGQDSSFAGNKTAQGNSDGGGIGDFYYTPPTGFLALCTKNLPDPTVIPSEHFNTVTYAGDSTNRTLTGVGFQPDFSWIKSRSNATNGSDHWLFDSVRGVNAFKGLCTNGTSVEGESAAGSTQENFGDISAFTSDGFSVYRSTADASHQYEGVNNSSETYVAWNWKAGNATLGTGDFTQGTIASTCSRNVDAGFSIVSYTGNLTSGANVGHGLSKAPEMIIVKNRTLTGEPWRVYHASNTTAPETDYLALDTTAATADNAAMWNDTAPSATLFTLGLDASTNGDEATIAYCFHSVDGYSKVGSYTGNGSTDGTFVYTSFAPKYVMIKVTSDTGGWHIYDDARTPYNVADDHIQANASGAESVSADAKIDILSNGFKARHSDSAINWNGDSYIFIAFAESPFKHTNAR